MYKVSFLQNGESGWQPATISYEDRADALEFVDTNRGYYREMEIRFERTGYEVEAAAAFEATEFDAFQTTINQRG